MTDPAGGRSRRRRAAALLLALALTTTSCGVSETAPDNGSARPGAPPASAPGSAGEGAPAPDESPGPTVQWAPCDGDFECATLPVPVNHEKPEGATLDLAIVRLPAADPDARIGALVVNPGGPGASAIEFVEGLFFSPEITDRFDIVGFDPRGVGRSSPLDCHTYLQDIYDADPTFEDDADRSEFLDVSQQFVDECENTAGDLLPHLGTVDVARDMDLVRAATGDEQLTYLGYSYGTSIGQQYARLFPERVRAMVLDGVVDTSETGLEAARGQAEGFSRALDAFIAECSNSCGLDRPAGAAVDAVIASSEAHPIPAESADRPATPGVVSLALAQALYSETLWPALASALGEGLDGNADELVTLADSYLRRNPDGTYPNGFEIYFAVSCLDAPWPEDPQDVFDEAKQVGVVYPRIGEALLNDYARCALWPTPPQPLQGVPTDIEGLAPVVVISTTGDPATPYQSGVDVAERVPGAVLITNEGEGHTIFGQGKRCIDEPVTVYLVDLEVPDDGRTC